VAGAGVKAGTFARNYSLAAQAVGMVGQGDQADRVVGAQRLPYLLRTGGRELDGGSSVDPSTTN
jgi:hypothetical protein